MHQLNLRLTSQQQPPLVVLQGTNIHKNSPQLKAWSALTWNNYFNGFTIPYTGGIVKQIYFQLHNHYAINYAQIKTEIKAYKIAAVQEIQFSPTPAKYLHHIRDFKRFLKAQRYSENTINSYVESIQIFLRYHGTEQIEDITSAHVDDFNTYYILGNNYSRSYQNQVISAVKLFFGQLLSTALDTESLIRPRKNKTLPVIFSLSEVEKILSGIQNSKHKCMLSLIYACGLRVGDLLSLRVQDLDSKRLVVHIHAGKGNKDRVVPLPKTLLPLLRKYYKKYKPSYYLFEGAPNKKYSNSSVRQIFKRALMKAKINKQATLHTLRHSYATHLLERGVNLRYIQEILGHNSSKTTEIYTHVSSQKLTEIESPIEKLNIF